ncbi:hypothetical protein LZ30DRAFT_714624, partial [Colletotrichum cereale]
MPSLTPTTPHRTAGPQGWGRERRGKAVLPSPPRILLLLDTQPASTPSRARRPGNPGAKEMGGQARPHLPPAASFRPRLVYRRFQCPPLPLHHQPSRNKSFLLPRGGRDVNIRRDDSCIHCWALFSQRFVFAVRLLLPGCVCVCVCVCVCMC